MKRSRNKYIKTFEAKTLELALAKFEKEFPDIYSEYILSKLSKDGRIASFHGYESFYLDPRGYLSTKFGKHVSIYKHKNLYEIQVLHNDIPF